MANQTGQSYPIAQLTRQTGLAADSPVVQYATQAPGNIGAFSDDAKTLSGVLQQLALNVEDRKDLYAADEAARAGALAGDQPGLPQRQDVATIRGKAFNMAAADAVKNRLDLEAHKAIDDYELQHPADPVGFEKKADSFLQGAVIGLQGYDSQLASKYQADFGLQKQNALQRIGERHLTNVYSGQQESAMQLLDKLDQDQSTLSASLFNGSGQDISKIMTQMTANAARQIDVAHSMGATGKPLFTADQRVSIQAGAEETVSSRIGQAWLNTQTDKIAALDKWRKGEAVMGVAGDKGPLALNLKDILSPTGYAAAEKDFIKSLKSELELKSQINAAQDHDFKKNSDSLYGDLAVVGQQGTLTANMVEAAKSSLEPERYVALSEVARRGGAAVSDGKVMSGLISADANGDNIQQQLIQAYRNGSLSKADYFDLYDRNTARLDKGVQSPVLLGRDKVVNSLGGMSKTLGPLQSVNIAQASAEYAQRIDDFAKTNQRQPTTSEAFEISDKVVRRYATIDASTVQATLPKPRYMTMAEKFSPDLTSQDVTKIMARTKAEYLKLHSGNVQQMEADEDYILDAKALAQYLDIARLKDSNAPKQ